MENKMACGFCHARQPFAKEKFTSRYVALHVYECPCGAVAGLLQPEFMGGNWILDDVKQALYRDILNVDPSGRGVIPQDITRPEGIITLFWAKR